MSEGVGQHTWSGPGKELARLPAALPELLSTAGPPLLFGIRLWLSVCLALYVSFYLELDKAFWAGITAAIVCQPQLGASLRKGWFLLIGNLVGATMIVVLTAAFPQDRVVFLGLLALWVGLCAYFATQLRNFASYAAALSGYTAVIVAAQTLGATGGSDGQVFMYAISRASEISIGILSAGIVLAGTDLGDARRKLACSIAALTARITCSFTQMLSRGGADMLNMQRQWREGARCAIALDPQIDHAMGESSQLRYHFVVLQTTVRGVLIAIDSWRTVGIHLARLAPDAASRQAETILAALPQGLRSVLASGASARWLADPADLRNRCETARLALLARPADTPSMRLLTDQTAKLLAGILRVLDGLALLADVPGRPAYSGGKFRLTVSDPLPAVLNAARAFVTVGVLMLFWVVTAWPSGFFAVVFGSIAILLLTPRVDLTPAQAASFAIGSALAAPSAAFIAFAVLPNLETFFPAFCLAIGLYYIPVGFAVGQPWSPTLSAVGTVMAFVFMPMVAPTNEMSFNTIDFYNTALAIFTGCSTAALSFHLLPPLPPAVRARRLLDIALRDLRRLVVASAPPSQQVWEQRMYGLLASMPDAAEPVDRIRLISAYSVGTEVISLRSTAHLLALDPEFSDALSALAGGNCRLAIARFSDLDHRLAGVGGRQADQRLAQRVRASLIIIAEAIARRSAFFEGRVTA
jgi:uncharacterized membrane protein YccC